MNDLLSFSPSIFINFTLSLKERKKYIYLGKTDGSQQYIESTLIIPGNQICAWAISTQKKNLQHVITRDQLISQKVAYLFLTSKIIFAHFDHRIFRSFLSMIGWLKRTFVRFQ